MKNDKRFCLYFELLERTDADTMVGVLDYGGDLKQYTRIRLFDFDAPEITGELRPFGKYVSEYADQLMPTHQTYQVISERFDRDAWARFLVNIMGSDGMTLSEHLLRLKMGIRYFDANGRPKSKDQRMAEHLENFRHHIEQGAIII